MQGNLGQNTPNNGVPLSTSQQHPLNQTTTPKTVLPIDRNHNDQSQQTNQMGHNTPFGFLPNASQKPILSGQTILKLEFCLHALLTLEKRVTRLCLLQPQMSNLSFQGNETEIQKVVYSHSAKGDDNHSSPHKKISEILQLHSGVIVVLSNK